MNKGHYIEYFVSGMLSFGVHRHINMDTDLRRLLILMILFKDTIKELDYFGSTLSYENISGVMKSKYIKGYPRYVYTNESIPKVLFAPPGL
jgi:hypothetical protein